jgi:hypothetical protein
LHAPVLLAKHHWMFIGHFLWYIVFQRTVGHWCLKHLTMADSFVMLPNLVSSEAFVCFVKCTLHVSWDNWERVSANDEIISSLDGESHVLIIQFCHYHWGIFVISLNNTWWS